MRELTDREILNEVRLWLTQNIGHAAASPSKSVTMTEATFRNLWEAWFGEC